MKIKKKDNEIYHLKNQSIENDNVVTEVKVRFGAEIEGLKHQIS